MLNIKIHKNVFSNQGSETKLQINNQKHSNAQNDTHIKRINKATTKGEKGGRFGKLFKR